MHVYIHILFAYINASILHMYMHSHTSLYIHLYIRILWTLTHPILSMQSYLYTYTNIFVYMYIGCLLSSGRYHTQPCRRGHRRCIWRRLVETSGG